jgi:hypothetical protein
VFTTFLCYLVVAYGAPQAGITGIISPLVLCFVLAFWISGMFSELLGMGIETILFCFMADEEMYKVEDRFAEAELMTTTAEGESKTTKSFQYKLLKPFLKVSPDTVEVKL